MFASEFYAANLKLGQVISRRTLASEMGMSFLPVSEALLRLEVEGLLESRPRAGTRVRIPTPQDVEGHFVVREALETQAARLFASTATPEEQAELFKLAIQLDDMAAVPENDRSQYLNRHERLHRKIAEYTRCQALADAIEQTHALASTWMCVGSGGTCRGGTKRWWKRWRAAILKRRQRPCASMFAPARRRRWDGSLRISSCKRRAAFAIRAARSSNHTWLWIARGRSPRGARY